LPTSVWNRIAEIQKEGGLQELQATYNRIESMNTEAWKIHGEMDQKLNECERASHVFQVNRNYHNDLKVITNYLIQAVQSNSKLEKMIHDDTQLYEELEKTQEQYNNDLCQLWNNEEKENTSKQGQEIEQTQDQEKLNAVESLKKWLEELNVCLKQREQWKKEYITQAESIDVISWLLNKEEEKDDKNEKDRKNWKTENIGDLQEIVDKIQITYTKQVTLLENIAQANQEFMKWKDSTSAQMRRENFIHRLNQACEKFNKCKMHLKDGLKFYSDLMNDYMFPLQLEVNTIVVALEAESNTKLTAQLQHPYEGYASSEHHR